MADGTVFELEMTQCRTKINAPSFFLIEEGYDLSGRTSDGFRVGLLRAASTEEFAQAAGELRGELDENGNNAGIFYRFDEPDSTFAVNGNTIMGDLIVTDFNSLNPIFGDSTTATIEIRCPDEG